MKKLKTKTKTTQKTKAMKKENMTIEEIMEFNSNVEYNESMASWITDIVCAIIAWPMILVAIRRRMKYSERIEIENKVTEVEQ